jgi:hypothetical protein
MSKANPKSGREITCGAEYAGGKSLSNMHDTVAGLLHFDEPAMCRSIKTLAHFEPPATEAEIRAAAVQFVRKLSGATRPSRANQDVFERAIDEVTAAASRLIHDLSTSGAPRNREVEAEKARERARQRYGVGAA